MQTHLRKRMVFIAWERPGIFLNSIIIYKIVSNELLRILLSNAQLGLMDMIICHISYQKNSKKGTYLKDGKKVP